MYKAAQKIFCTACGREALSALEQLLILFVSSRSTYSGAVRHLHISQGYGDSLKGWPQLQLVLRGFKKQPPRSQYNRLPITHGYCSKSDKHNLITHRNLTVCCLRLFPFLISDEFTMQSSNYFDATWHLTPRDIAIVNPSLMKIYLKG